MEDATKSGSATVGVSVPAPMVTDVTVGVVPSSITTAQTAQATATVTGTGNYSSAVTWAVGPAGIGTVSSTGLFTPAATGTATITATSTEDTTKFGTATLTVTAAASCDATGTNATAQNELAVYGALRSSDGAVTVMVINKTYGALTSTFSLEGVTATGPAAVYQYSNANLNAIVTEPSQAVTAPEPGSTTGTIGNYTFPAESITLFVIPQ